MKAKRHQVYVAVLVCMSLVIVGLAGYLVWDKVIYNKGASADVVATRTMLSQKVSYDGSWVTEAEGLFEVYIPGTLDTSKEWKSMAVTSVHDTEYDNSLKRAFGVVYSDEKLDISSVSLDPMLVLSSVSDQITNDIAGVCLGGRPSVAYDVEVVTLANGEEAVKISGDMELTFMMQKSKTDTETYEEQLNYPVIAYITLQKGYPVGVWCTYDQFDYWCSEEVPTQLEEMVSTIWQTKFTGEDVEWVEVPTTLDENRRIIFPENYGNEDSSESDDEKGDSSEPDVGAPSWVGRPEGEEGDHVHEVIPEADIVEDVEGAASTLPEG